MNIHNATASYETWLRQRIPLLAADLRLKHQRMAESPFPFLRATFYRWAQLWPRICPELAHAPRVLGVGDLHVENFGTWRDTEGRLIWGVNDFDEVAPMPYANDLVRLAVSACLAIREDHLSCSTASACEAILTGYSESIQSGGEPFVLAERHGWLREVATGRLRDPTLFWQKLTGLPTVRAGLPAGILSTLREALPDQTLPIRVVHRQAGLGSLGRRRFTALAFWRGGWIAREAKELVTSALFSEVSSSASPKATRNPLAETGRGSVLDCGSPLPLSFAKQRPKALPTHRERTPRPFGGSGRIRKRRGPEILYQKVINQAIRVPDPYVFVRDHWLIRRLAPYCSRLELSSLPKAKDELKLLHAMGWETANIHLGSRASAPAVLKDLRKRPSKWLLTATQAMAKATLDDWKTWAKGGA